MYGLIFCWANDIFPKIATMVSPVSCGLLQCNLDLFPIERRDLCPLPWNLGRLLSALRAKVMSDDFQDWIIKHGAVSISFARTLELEDLSHCVRTLTPLMPSRCKTGQPRLGTLHLGTLVNISNYQDRPQPATSKNTRHMSENPSRWFPQLSTLPNWSHKYCGIETSHPSLDTVQSPDPQNLWM